ncbi:MAG TPA: hypothetical protein PLJ47_15725 [Candidatus Hydrogenedentes bacterium]|nr:hypothetical protein [Candidatus Hydrogenedentota bacterium]
MSNRRLFTLFAVLLIPVLLMGIGVAPRYIEELAIGGGYASAPDGGSDLEADGDFLTDGEVTIGRNEAVDHRASILTGAGNKAFLNLNSPGAMHGGALWFDGATDTLALGTRNGSATPTAAFLITQGSQDVAFQSGISTKGEVHVGDGSASVGRLRFAGPSGVFRRTAYYTGASSSGANLRWEIGASEHAESSTYNGSALRISAYDNTGAFIDTPIFIERDPGQPARISRNTRIKLDLNVEGGDIVAGADSTTRGVVTAWDGSGGAAPGCLKLASPNGTIWYVFVEDDGTLKVSSALPTANADGAVVGTQF